MPFLVLKAHPCIQTSKCRMQRPVLLRFQKAVNFNNFRTVLLSFLLSFLQTDSALKTLKSCHCYPGCPECILHCHAFLRLKHFATSYGFTLVLPSILALPYNSFVPDAHLTLNFTSFKKKTQKNKTLLGLMLYNFLRYS